MAMQQFIDDLERRRLEAEKILGGALSVGAAADPDALKGATVNPAVQEALDSYEPPKPSNEPSVTDKGDGTYDVKLGGALRGVHLPFTPGVPASSGEKEEKTEEPLSIYDLLARSEAVRQKLSENWERNERSNKARTTIAAVTDALASLGNLVGTTQGAFNQDQTYQTPLVASQREEDRAYARRIANALYENDSSLRLAKMKMDAQASALDKELAKQDMITQRALLLAQQRADLAGVQHGYRTEEEAQKQQGRLERDEANNAVKVAMGNDRNTTSVRTANIRADATRYSADKRAENGGVNGYETQTTIIRDPLGNELGRTTRRIPGSGGGSSANGSGGSSSGSSSSKTPPSRQNKNSKTPPSKRK